MTNPTKILFIAGSGRSGSTLLDLILNEIEGFFSVGELMEIWSRNFVDDRLCGCGKRFHSCDFWVTVLNRAFGGATTIDAKEMTKLMRSLIRLRQFPFLSCPLLRTHNYRIKLKKYADVLARLFLAVREVSDSKVIIDSSKFPTQAIVLNDHSDIELYLVHLVRDSRAVAYSWQRKKRQRHIHWKTTNMVKFSSFQSSVMWSGANLVAEFMKLHKGRYLNLRYEDFVSRPKQTVSHILDFIGEKERKLDFLDSDQIPLGVGHSLNGNPLRLQQSGMVRLKYDNEWLERMARSQRRIVSFLTWPLLMKYGYL